MVKSDAQMMNVTTIRQNYPRIEIQFCNKGALSEYRKRNARTGELGVGKSNNWRYSRSHRIEVDIVYASDNITVCIFVHTRYRLHLSAADYTLNSMVVLQ